MITSKQRAYLRSLANNIDTILIIGKSGICEDTLKQAEGALKARELIKVKVLETSPVPVREAAQQISSKTNSILVQVIGSKFIIYRRNEKEPKISLPKSSKK